MAILFVVSVAAGLFGAIVWANAANEARQTSQARHASECWRKCVWVLAADPTDERRHHEALGWLGKIHPGGRAAYAERFYQLILNHLGQHPDCLGLRILALEVGRVACGNGREGGRPTVYDEQAIQNDIQVRTTGRHATDMHDERPGQRVGGGLQAPRSGDGPPTVVTAGRPGREEPRDDLQALVEPAGVMLRPVPRTPDQTEQGYARFLLPVGLVAASLVCGVYLSTRSGPPVPPVATPATPAGEATPPTPASPSPSLPVMITQEEWQKLSEVYAAERTKSAASTPPSNPVAVTPPTSRPSDPPREPHYRDRDGKLVTEREIEGEMRKLREAIQAVPDPYRRAFCEGVLKAFQDEWVRIKRAGPVDD